ncbi:MAG: dihydrofolate reductase [Hyphomicrobiales bacterium]|nr:MAG: dihydrofolate reductase [Hyphomicrobiales bacterium]
MRVVAVVAVADNGVIGRNGGLPWRLSSDLKYFRRMTMDKPVIMGRKTYASIGKPLDGRDNIVVTRQPGFAAPGIDVVATPEAALALALEKAKARGADEIAVIGGAEIYASLMPHLDRIYLTRVHGTPDGDATFALDMRQWREVERSEMARTEKDAYDATFITLDRAS